MGRKIADDLGRDDEMGCGEIIEEVVVEDVVLVVFSPVGDGVVKGIRRDTRGWIKPGDGCAVLCL